MILPTIEAMRFFCIFDELTIYAHDRLHVVSDAEFYTGEPPRGIGDEGQRKTSEELWNNPQVIDDFVRLNPAGLPASELNIALSWKGAYTDTFFVDRSPSGTLLFLGGDYGFEVSGMSRHIEDMLHAIPAMVQTTLLPYEDCVVYAQHIMEYPAVMGEGMLSTMQKSLREVVQNKAIVSTGERLLEVAPTLKVQKEERRLEEFRHDMEMAERAEGPLPGQHRGILAGLSFEDRERAILEHMNDLDAGDDTFQELRYTFMQDRCIDCEETDILEELLRTDDPKISEQDRTTTWSTSATARVCNVKSKVSVNVG